MMLESMIYNEDAPIEEAMVSPAAARPSGTAITSSVSSSQDAHLEWVDGEKWDRLAAGFDDVRQEQTNCFAASRWGGGRLEQVVVVRDGVNIGGGVVLLVTVPGTNRGIAILKWGPLWRRRGQLPDIENLKLSLLLFHQEYVLRRRLYLSIVPQIDPGFCQIMDFELKALGFKPGSRLAYPERYFVNTSIGADDLMSSLDQKWRYNLKKSRKAGFTIDWVAGDEGLSSFMHLYDQMLARKNFHDSSAILTLPSLLQNSVKSHKPAIVMVYHEGTPTAGAVIDVSGDCAVYLYGATDERALPLRAGYAMHWWIAEKLCNDPAVKWYDLGGNDGDRGLHQFKKGFVGKQGQIVDSPASHDCCKNFIGTAIGRCVFTARDIKGALSRLLHSSRLSLGK